MKEYLLFRKMVSPILIQVIFWLGIIYSIVYGIMSMVYTGFFYGLWFLVAGVIGTRVFCEVLMLFFKMNDNLNNIKKALKK